MASVPPQVHPAHMAPSAGRRAVRAGEEGAQPREEAVVQGRPAGQVGRDADRARGGPGEEERARRGRRALLGAPLGVLAACCMLTELQIWAVPVVLPSTRLWYCFAVPRIGIIPRPDAVSPACAVQGEPIEFILGERRPRAARLHDGTAHKVHARFGW